MLKENEGREGERWEGEVGRHLEKKQPDSPAVCRRRGKGKKKRGERRKINREREKREANMK